MQAETKTKEEAPKDTQEVPVTVPAQASKKDMTPSKDILTRNRAYSIFRLTLPSSMQPATTEEEVINQMSATIKQPGPNCHAVKATDLSGLKDEELSLRRVLDRVVESSGSKLFHAIPGIDYTDPANAKKKIEESIEKDIPTYDECLKAAGIEIKQDTMAGKQQLEEFKKKYEEMRNKKIERDIQLYLTGATQGIAIAEDDAIARKNADTADEKAYKDRIKNLDSDEDLQTLVKMGPADDAFMQQLVKFIPDSRYENAMAMLKDKTKEVCDGLYVKLDSNGEKVFIVVNGSVENTKKIIEAQKNREIIEWSNVSPTNTKRHAEIQKLCLAKGKRATINGVETALSKAMPPGDPENYTKWIQNIRAIQDPIERDRCLKQLGDVIEEKGPDAKRQFWSHVSQYGSVEDRAAALVAMREERISTLQAGVVTRIKDSQKMRTNEKIGALVTQLDAKASNENEDLMKLVEGRPKEAEKLGRDLKKDGIFDSVSVRYLKRLDNIAEKLKAAEKASPAGTMEQEEKNRGLVLEEVKKLSKETTCTPQLKEYLKKREELEAAVKRGNAQEIAKLKDDVAVLAKKVISENGNEIKAVDALEKQDQAVYVAEEKVKLRAEFTAARKGYLALAGSNPELLDRFLDVKLSASEIQEVKQEIDTLTDDFSGEQKKNLSDYYKKVLNVQQQKLKQGPELLAATERKFGLFITSEAKGDSKKIIGAVVKAIINPVTQLEVLNGLPEPYKTNVKKEPTYEEIEQIEQGKVEQRVDTKLVQL